MNLFENAALRTEADARLLEALQEARILGWIGSERGLAEDLGLATTVFYKVRNGLQSFPQDGLFKLEKLLGLNPAYVREGIRPPFALPTKPSGEKLSVYERIRIAALAEASTAETVMEKMGLTATKWKALKSGSDAQVAGLAQALGRAFPLISTAWLLMGMGLPQALATTVPLPPSPTPATSMEPLVIHLPFVDARARASFVSGFLSGSRPDELPLQPYLARTESKPPKDALLIEVEGDSMVPTLYPRDTLLIAPVPSSEWKYLSGGIYTILYGFDHLVVKRVQRNTLATEGLLRLLSDNPTGGELELPAEELQGIFKVLAVTRTL